MSGSGGSGGAGAQGLLPTKSQKGRRKISLPWFRQNSVTAPHATLSRQHTIDSPGSFRFFRQSSNSSPQVRLFVYQLKSLFYCSWFTIAIPIIPCNFSDRILIIV